MKNVIRNIEMIKKDDRAHNSIVSHKLLVECSVIQL